MNFYKKFYKIDIVRNSQEDFSEFLLKFKKFKFFLKKSKKSEKFKKKSIFFKSSE